MNGEARAELETPRSTPARSLRQAVGMIRQRLLFRVAVAYAIGAWLVVQVVATIAPAFDFPEWTLRAVILLALTGFVATAVIVALTGPSEASVPPAARRRRLALAAAAVLVLVAGAGSLVYSQGAALLGVNRYSVAVLPFADLSPNRDKAYFAEGVAEEILSTLAHEKDIKVLGRTSARQIERDADPAAVRSALGVTHLLEGSARSAGDQLRINVRLIDTSDGSQLWEEEYRGRLADVFKVQDEIAQTVVKRLRGTFFGSPVRAAEAIEIDAYQTYLAARALMRDPKAEPLKQARKMAQAIVRSHPDYALGHALLADSTMLLADGFFFYGDIPLHRARPIAVVEARRAIRLAPDRAEGYAALGLALPASAAVAPLQKAIALDRSWAVLRGRLGIALDVLGRHDEAFEQYRLAVETDPLSSSLVNRYVTYLGGSGRSKDAFAAIDKYVERGGSEAQAWRFRGNVFGKTGDLSQSIAARRRALSLDLALPYQDEWLALSLHFLGLDDQASTHVPKVSRYLQLFIADDRGALKATLARDGAKAWSANGVEYALFSLARSRDWPAIVRFHDLRPSEQRDLCVGRFELIPFLAMALERQGRGREASGLFACFQRGLSSRLRMRYRSPDIAAGELEMWQASLFALGRDRRAIDWLDKAVSSGWSGQYASGRLADWPQFDAIAADPGLAAIQRRIDAKITAERAEIEKRS